MMINKCPQLIEIIVCDSDLLDWVNYLLSFTVISAYAVHVRIEKFRHQLFCHIEKNHQDVWDDLDLSNFGRFFYMSKMYAYNEYFREGKYREKNDVVMNDLCKKLSAHKIVFALFFVSTCVLSAIVFLTFNV